MKIIPLSQGKNTLVDDSDYEWLSQWKWCCGKFGYAVRKVTGGMCFMHQEIMGVPRTIKVIHKNGDILDNHRSNLRVCER